MLAVRGELAVDFAAAYMLSACQSASSWGLQLPAVASHSNGHSGARSEGHGALVEARILAVHGLEGCRGLVLPQAAPQESSAVHQVQRKGKEYQACMPGCS